MPKLPRTGDELLAEALDVHPTTAARLRARLGSPPEFDEVDATLRAESALADLDSARSITADDVEFAAEQDDPRSALDEMLEQRSEASLRGRIAAHVSWAKTEDRRARTAPARAAMDQKFLDEAGGDPVRAEHLRKAYYLRLALKSAKARRAKRQAT